MSDPKYFKREGDKCYMNFRGEHWQAGDSETLQFMKTHTTYEVIKHRAETIPETDLFGYRKREGDKYVGEYLWLKSIEVLHMTDSLASGIVRKFGLKKGDFVGIISGNRYEWFITQFALQRHGIIPIPLYTTLGKEAIDYIITTLNMKYVFCTYSKTVEEMCERHNHLFLVCYDTYDKIMNNIDSSVKYMKFEELVKEGEKHIIQPDLPQMNDTFSIIFTSGTSGIPKGAVHTFRSAHHSAFIINSANVFVDLPMKDQHYFSFLPSAHVLDQEINHAFIFGGGKVSYISGGIPTLMEDLKYSQPTFFITVPRVLQKIYDVFNSTLSQSSCLVKTMFNIAYHYKANAVKGGYKTLIDWDSIVFHKIHSVFGGKLKLIMNGGAPLTADLYEWLRVCSGAIVLQGYGLTETFGGICASLPNMTNLNELNVGSMGPEIEMRLVSVPEMGYSVDDEYPSGEIQVRAPQNFSYYYKNEEQTHLAIDSDGFFSTGDIGRLTKDASLSIVDRKKNLFKLAQGEYIAVEPLEGKYGAMPIIQQIYVHGESSDVFVSGIVVIEKSELKNYPQLQLPPKGDDIALREALNKMENRKILLKAIQDFIRSMKVPGYEVIKNVYFETIPFSTENNMMTPSFKLKRVEIKKTYQEQLHTLRYEVVKNLI